MSQPEKQTIAITHCPISQDNQMKFGHLIEYNMWNIFLE